MRLGIITDRTKEGFELARAKGLSFVELSVNEPGGVDGFMAEIPGIIDWSHETGVKVGSIGRWGAGKVDADGRIIESELENFTKLLEACELLECKSIGLDCNYISEISLLRNVQNASRYFELVSRFALDKGVKAAVCNDSRNNFIHSEPVWELLLGDIPELYIMYSPAHAVYRGQDYLLQAAKWGGRFAHVRLKGSLRISGARFDDPPAGLDGTDWKAFLSCLYAHGYDGDLSIEPHSATWKGPLGDWGIDYTASYFKSMIYGGGPGNA